MLALGLVGGGLIIWGVTHIDSRTLEPQLGENGKILVGIAISGSAALGWMLQRYEQTKAWEWRDRAIALLIAFATIFEAGIFTAALELSDRLTYTVNTKSGAAFENVRILRTSSAGFIVSISDRVMFIPQSEMTNVSSTPYKK